MKAGRKEKAGRRPKPSRAGIDELRRDLKKARGKPPVALIAAVLFITVASLYLAVSTAQQSPHFGYKVRVMDCELDEDGETVIQVKNMQSTPVGAAADIHSSSGKIVGSVDFLGLAGLATEWRLADFDVLKNERRGAFYLDGPGFERAYFEC